MVLELRKLAVVAGIRNIVAEAEVVAAKWLGEVEGEWLPGALIEAVVRFV